MTGVQNIEAAVRKYDFLAGLLRFTNVLGNYFDGINLCRHCSWRLERGLTGGLRPSSGTSRHPLPGGERDNLAGKTSPFGERGTKRGMRAESLPLARVESLTRLV